MWWLGPLIAVVALAVITAGLLAIASAGNIYCPKCGGEELIPAKRGKDGYLIYICKDCKNEW